VKTKIRNNQSEEIIQKARTNRRLIGKKIFNGIFGYKYEDIINSGNITLTLKRARGYVNYI